MIKRTLKSSQTFGHSRPCCPSASYVRPFVSILFSIVTLWLSLHPSRIAYSWDLQNVNRSANCFGIVGNGFFDKPFGVGNEISFTVNAMIFYIGTHFNISANWICDKVASIATFFCEYCKAYIVFPNHLKVFFVHNQSRTILAGEYYIENNTTFFSKFLIKFSRISCLHYFSDGAWISSFDILNRTINVFNESSICLKSSINYLRGTKPEFFKFSISSHCIKIIENRPDFTGNIETEFTICGNNNFGICFDSNTSSLSDSITQNKKCKKRIDKPKYLRFTPNGVTEKVHLLEPLIFGLNAYDIDVSPDECKTWFHLFDDKCVNGLPSYFDVRDSLKTK